jgi:hypothetical protein
MFKRYLGAFVAALLLAAIGGYAFSQNANQVINTLLGNELVQIQSATNSTAAISYTTVANLRDGRQWLYNVPVTSFTITMSVAQSVVSLNPAGTLAAGTIVMPATGFDGKTVTLFSTQTISALTLSTTNSATFVPAAITTLTANTPISYVYDLANNQWHRFQ